MTRRDLALVVTLATAVGGAGVMVLSLREGEPSAAGPAARSDAAASATETPPLASPAGAPAAGPDGESRRFDPPAGEPAGEPAATDFAAALAPEPAEEVDFPGLIEVAHRPEEAIRLDGTLVLRNADPAAPPLRLEIPVRNARFRGRGPASAVVEVERLVLSGREAVAREESFKLASRWLQVHATMATPFLLHVVDEASGRELNGVTLREGRHVENEKSRTDGTASGWFTLIRAKHSTAPPAGFDSPLQFAQFGWDERRSSLPFATDAESFVVVHVDGFGDDGFEVMEDERERTLHLRPAASLRVTVTPLPAPGHVVTVARCVDRTVASGFAIPPGLTPRLEALAREASARRRRRKTAAESPQRHVAPTDAHGVANFDDLCAGEWLAWSGPGDDAGGGIAFVNGRRVRLHGDSTDPLDPVAFTAFAGGRGELSLRVDSPYTTTTTLVVRGVDATSGEPVALRRDEIEVNDVDEPQFETRAVVISGRAFGRGSGRFPIGDDGSVGAGEEAPLDVRPGVAIVRVVPRAHPEFEPADRWIELVEGANELVVPLARAQGILVTIDADKAFAAGHVDWFEETVVRLVRDGVEFQPSTWWNHGRDEPSRLLRRFGPLETGRYTLIVPEGVGFDRAGEVEVEVRPHALTAVELELRGDAATTPRDGGR